MKTRLSTRLPALPVSHPSRLGPRVRQWTNNPPAIHHPSIRKPMSTSSSTAAAAASAGTTPTNPNTTEISAASKSAEIQAELTALTTPPNGKWHFHDSPRRLERSFTFPDFNAAWRFMSAVADECEKHKHHPEWSNVYNQVFVRWTTHKPPGGVRKKDRDMARVCDEIASLNGVLEDVKSGGGSGKANGGGGLDGLVGAVSDAARDCCADGQCANPKV